MRVLVTGATGFIGRHLVGELLRAGHVVRALVRNLDDAYLLEAQGVELVEGNIGEVAKLSEACCDMEGVFHLAGVKQRTKGASLRAVNVDGARLAVQCADEAGVGRFVFLSTLATSANAFYRSKEQAAQIVRQKATGFTILRSTPVFGANGGLLAHMAAFYRTQLFAFVPGTGRTIIQPIHVRNLVQMLLRAIQDSRHAGKTYDVAGPRKYTLNEVADMVARHMGKKLPKVHMPRFFLEANSYLMSHVTERTLLGKGDFALLAGQATCDPYPAAEALGVQLLSVEEGIVRAPWPHFRMLAASRKADV